MATIGRLSRVHTLALSKIGDVLATHGLSVGEFDVLASLRRAGEPYELRPIDLARNMMLSPAGITSRIDRLESAGWITRRHDRQDRRSFLVTLTDTGEALIDRAVTDHVANEARLLAGLTDTQRAALDTALRALSQALAAMPRPARQ
jgi:DNA-binding MarR family transcriptional regulator